MFNIIKLMCNDYFLSTLVSKDCAYMLGKDLVNKYILWGTKFFSLQKVRLQR